MRQYYIVLNRIAHEFAEYHGCLLPGEGELAFVTTAHGASALGSNIATEMVDALTYEAAEAAVSRIIRRFGAPSSIQALSDYDVLTAARLRDAFGIRGAQSTELVTRFKDKPTMKAVLGAVGLRVPRFHCVTDDFDPVAVADDLGLPMIVKPRDGVASRGVSRVDTMSALRAALAGTEEDYECEEYMAGTVIHVDGVRRAGKLCFATASDYVNTCLDYAASGSALGSVLMDPGPRRDAIIRFADECLDALALRNGAFHMELIESPTGELCFLEVGLRPGGAQVAHLHRELFGIDLFAEAFRAGVGLEPLGPLSSISPDAGGGWLLIPEPSPTPCRLTRASSLGPVPQISYEAIAPVGRIFRGTGGYDDPAAIFRFHGDCAAEVKAAICRVIDDFEFVVEPVPG